MVASLLKRTFGRTLGCVASRIIPKTELRDRIRQELADLGEDTLVITDRGRPKAVVVSVARWNALQSSLEDLEDAVAILEHRRSRGRGRSARVALAEIEAEKAHVPRPARKTS
jgi:prevent-host-death family protein